MRRLIFLDIDGVLAHFGSHDRLDPRCLAHLDGLVGRTAAQIVLSSSWRETIGLDETRRRLARAGLKAPISAATPVLACATRSDEIAAFLAGATTRFAILDDQPTRFRQAQVLVDEFVGLTAEDAVAAERILQA